MKIAFYAPLKSPRHPVPSGDRLMARQLLAVLSDAGHDVHIISDLRSFSATPDLPAQHLDAARTERERITADWHLTGAPDLWFCYHPYYKAPDLLGPALCQQFAVPYVTVECSYSARRNIGGWATSQDQVRQGIKQAAVNICLTARDRRGLMEAVPEANFAQFPPFIDAEPLLAIPHAPQSGHLVTVAMMRPGDKLSSYTALAAALRRVRSERWTLSVVGDGPARDEVAAAFAGCPRERIRWHGELGPDDVRRVLSTGALYLWPGHGEAYGLAYLEAQAAGLPVIAEAVAGVPEVVMRDRTGILVPPSDAAAFAAAIDGLLADDARRKRLSEAARHFVSHERSMDAAKHRLDAIIQSVTKGTP